MSSRWTKRMDQSPVSKEGTAVWYLLGFELNFSLSMLHGLWKDSFMPLSAFIYSFLSSIMIIRSFGLFSFWLSRAPFLFASFEREWTRRIKYEKEKNGNKPFFVWSRSGKKISFTIKKGGHFLRTVYSSIDAALIFLPISHLCFSSEDFRIFL